MTEQTLESAKNNSEIAEYSEFEKQLSEFEDNYLSRVYVFDKAKDLKDAKSDRFTVRQVKAAIEKTRKKIKQPHIDAGKLIDEKAKDFKERAEKVEAHISAQIEQHEKIEQERQAKLESMIKAIVAYGELPNNVTSDAVRERLAMAEAVEITEAFEERADEAAAAKGHVIDTLKQALPEIEKREAEAAELARLREEAEARRKQDEEDRMRREAEEKAKAEAEAAVERERQARIRAEEEGKLAAQEAIEREKQAKERAEREKLEAMEQARREEQARIEAERKAKAEQEERERQAALAAPDADKLTIIGKEIDALIAGLPPVESELAKVAMTRIAKTLSLVSEDCLSTAQRLKQG